MDIQIIKKKNTKCGIKDSSLCKWLDKQECGDCYIMELTDQEQAEALERWQVTQSLMPENIDDLHTSELCHFCIGERLPKAYYATVDLANPEPAATKGMFFGLGKKVRSAIGSLLPVSIACCSRCRKAFLWTDIIKFAVPVLFFGLALLLLSMPFLSGLFAVWGPLVSTLFVIALFLIGLLVGKMVSNAYIQKKGKTVRFNVFDIPIIAEMQDKGWFLMQDDGALTRLIFKKIRGGQIKTLKTKND